MTGTAYESAGTDREEHSRLPLGKPAALQVLLDAVHFFTWQLRCTALQGQKHRELWHRKQRTLQGHRHMTYTTRPTADNILHFSAAE